MKKHLSVILIAVMLLSVVFAGNLTAYAATSGTCGDDITYTITDNVLTLSGTGDMYHYDFWSHTVPWDAKKGTITKVVVEEGITSLGTNAFCDFVSLTEVELPTTLKTMGMNAFACCESLTEFTVPVGLESFDVSAFANCYGMLEYKVAEGNTHFTVEDGVLFNIDKTALWSYPIGLTDEVYDMPDTVESVEAYAFSEAANLNEILFSENLKHIGDEAFHNCIGLTEIVLPDGFLTTGGGSFQGCENLSQIDLPDTVTRIGPLCFDMTAYYNNLSNWENDLVLYLDEFVLQGREKWDEVAGESGIELGGEYRIKEGTKLIADEAFDFLPISAVYLPASLQYIGEGAFYGCDNLTEIDIPGNVTHIGEIAFTSCENLASVKLPGNLQRIGYNAFENTAYLNALVTAENPIGYDGNYVIYAHSSLTAANIKEGTTLIAENAFEKATSVRTITLPESLLYIGSEAFINTTSTKNITVPKTVVSIGDYAFGYSKHYSSAVEAYVYTPIYNFMLSGYTDSAAEAYAEEFDVPFDCLDGCEHQYGSTVTTPATCTTAGVRTYACGLCGDSYTEVIPAGHTDVVIDPAVEPGCNTNGMTEGSHCEACGTVIVEQLPTGSLNHRVGIEMGEAPSCGEGGKTEAIWCMDCQKYIKEPEYIPPTNNHRALSYEEVPANCVTEGLTGGTFCGWCGQTLTERTVVPTNDYHINRVIDYAETPTCTKEGKTQGSHCGACGDIIIPQEIVPKANHTYDTRYTIDKVASGLETGYKSRHCKYCAATTDCTELPLVAPVFVQMTPAGIALAYEPYDDVVSYEVYRLSDEMAGYEHVGTTPQTTFFDSSAVLGGVYRYMILLTDANEKTVAVVTTEEITYATSLIITTQPKTTYAENGATVKVKVGATGDGLTYTWYVKNAGATKFVKSSITSATYSVKMSSTTKNRSVYCVVTDKYGNAKVTETVQLRMAVTLNAQPSTAYAKNGAMAKVSVSATGDGLKYTWYVKNAGATKYVKSSITSATYSVKMSSAVKNRSVYCVITDKYGNTAKTKEVQLRMAATVTTQPKTTYTKSGATAKATVGAAGDGLKYTWYVKNAGATKYVKSSITTATYSVKMSNTVKNRSVYCVITDKYGNSVKTDVVQLRMKATITTQPKITYTKSGETAKVTVGAAGDGLKYTWYVKNAGATMYVKSSITTATYSVKMSNTVKNRSVYCVVTDKYGNTAKTNTVQLKMK